MFRPTSLLIQQFRPWRTWRREERYYSLRRVPLLQRLMFGNFYLCPHFGYKGISHHRLVPNGSQPSSSVLRTAVRSDTFSVHPSSCDAPVGFCRSTRWPRRDPRKMNIITDFFHPYFYPPTSQLDTVATAVFLLFPSRARAFIPGAVQYSFLLYHPMYFIMYRSIYGKGVRKRSHRAAHVPKWHLLEKAIPLFLPLQIPQTEFYKVLHDYTITLENPVFSRIFPTRLFCILQEKTQPH